MKSIQCVHAKGRVWMCIEHNPYTNHRYKSCKLTKCLKFIASVKPEGIISNKINRTNGE
jgi:hypothetical protein